MDGNTEPRKPRRVARVVAPLAAAALVGAGAGAGVYAGVGGGSHAAAPAQTKTVTQVVQPAALARSTAALSATDIYDKDAPGVVDITVDSTTTSGGSGRGFGPFGFPGGQGGQQQTQAEGSGFVIDKDGHIVTNQHVVDGANSITVKFKDGTTTKATLVGSDASTDLAVIKVDVSSSKLTPLTLGDSSDVEPGEGVVAIGSPFGLPYSITAGIVSATGRTIQSPNGYSIGNAIQTDAPINHGNSGGPLIDASGDVIGVNAQIDSQSSGNNGVGFAIPSNTVKQVSSQIISGGTIQHAFLGVQIADAPGGGARIGAVQSGTPADKAGLKAGDVVTAVDGKSISDSGDLTDVIGSHKPGDKVTLTVKSGGSTKSVDVTLGTRPNNSQ